MCVCASFFLSCSRSRAVRRHAADRTPVPEPDTSQTEKASHFLLQGSDLRAGETLPPAEVPGQRRAGGSGQEPEDDRRTGQNLVSEPQDQVEVSVGSHTRAKLVTTHIYDHIPSHTHPENTHNAASSCKEFYPFVASWSTTKLSWYKRMKPHVISC